MPSEPTVEEVRELMELAEATGLAVVPVSSEMIASLCNHFLASQQPMTAGEFAGLVIGKAMEQEAYWHQGELDAHPNQAFIARCKTRSDTWNRVQAMIYALAAEHNITIVEPKK